MWCYKASASVKETFKFGLLFTGSELAQQLVIKKVWDSNWQLRWSSDQRLTRLTQVTSSWRRNCTRFAPPGPSKIANRWILAASSGMLSGVSPSSPTFCGGGTVSSTLGFRVIRGRTPSREQPWIRQSFQVLLVTSCQWSW